jgi:hypothetical protein
MHEKKILVYCPDIRQHWRPLSCSGNLSVACGKHIETINMFSPINPLFPVTIICPKDISKNDVFSRAGIDPLLKREF